MAMPLGGILLLFLVLLAAAAAGGGGGLWAFSSSSSSSSYSRIGEQPLSLIGIHRATVGIDAAASVQASPRLLGVKIASVVTGHMELLPTPDRVKCASTCPGPSGSDSGPVICSAPIKYQLANYSSDYGKTGKGTLKFQLINQRQDFSFALFTGGLSNPKLIAVSNKIAFANPKAPVYPRLAQGKSWNEMTVTWTSGYDIKEAYPFVEWGMKWSPPTRTAAGTVTFDRESLCGEPARTVGWRDPGFIHTAFLTDLWPNKEYYYKIGHMLPDGKIVWGKFYSFKAPPFPGQKSLQRVVIFGDMGKAERDGSNEYSNYQPGSLNTTDTLIKDLDNIDIVFHIGDITYANGYISQWDQFTQQVEPITARVPYMIARSFLMNIFGLLNLQAVETMNGIGQTVDLSSMGQILEGSVGCLLRPCTTHPQRTGQTTGTRRTTGCSDSACRTASTTGGKARSSTRSSKAALQRWTGRSSHGWCSSRTASSATPRGFFYGAGGAFAEPTARQSLQRLWQRHRVDLAFYGHVHNYERTCPVYDGRCASPERSRYSGAVGGTIHAVVGGGGSHLSNFTAEAPPWSVYREMDYGFVKLTAFNYTSLLYEYRRSSDGEVHDSFTVHREYRDVLACVADSCPPTIPPAT
ncbi:hypothetical protein OsJ_29936 [Oryza sativa Japonica Group]|uniref:Uncharacterized protein n=1 Tax=Oryza sativa subsp. japonica TaxID=39947 RepID=A3C0F4_ORYSJ|nr:hypothetical protein OsJ_29936 [Oryza sativa Japonica Group]